MILTKHEETKKGRLFHENEKLRVFVSSCSINYLYQVIFLSSLKKTAVCKGKQRLGKGVSAQITAREGTSCWYP